VAPQEPSKIDAQAGWRTGEPLAPEQLYCPCDFGDLAFETVDELPDLLVPVGQERALSAVEFAIGIRRDGFNLFVLGPAGTGRRTLVKDLIERQAAKEATPQDWCYVNNFGDPRHPRCLGLPVGRAKALSDSMRRLVDELRVALPAAFERDEYRARHDILDQQLKQRHETAFGDLQRRAQEKGIALIRTPVGLALAPAVKGEVIGPEAFNQLPEAEQERIKTDIQALQGELEGIVRRIPDWEREHRQALRELNRGTTSAVVGHLLQDIRAKYQDLPEVVEYLQSAERDLMETAEEVLKSARDAQEPAAMDSVADGPPWARKYQVNVMVDNSATQGAPVIFEDHPTHLNMVGRIEQMARFGALLTDFNLILPGALHRANGGYLVLDVEQLLMSSFGWESLKRALRAGEIRTASLEQMLSLATTVSLEPQPIPLALKVVLVGAPRVYYLLASADPDFHELFKVAADFDDRVPRSAESMGLYARLLGSMVRREKLKPLDRAAAARSVEHASRLSEDRDKLSTRVADLKDLLQEADHIAGRAGHERIGAADIQAAIDAQINRADRYYRRIHEEIGRNTIRVETAGEQIGQVNGLSVVGIGGFSFGQPSRITARIRLGHGEVIDIEREVALGGPLHSKGVLILAGFLGGRFGRDAPLSLTASLVFEQSYGGVDGDSASSAELYALMSALADVPIRQSFAVTGSVDQLGRVQAIGGVNEKIEGFFDVCRAKGLTGEQGVLIPASNVRHLMLRHDVVEAARAGRFRIIGVESIDQGIELLTGIPAGVVDISGNYPAGTVNQRIAARFAALSKKARQFGSAAGPRRRKEKPRG
jgi:predicted ATP-dependent protease